MQEKGANQLKIEPQLAKEELKSETESQNILQVSEKRVSIISNTPLHYASHLQ